MPTKSGKSAVALLEIEDKIYVSRDQRVMLDSDLAIIYKVETRALNQAVNRNLARFPKDFVFQLIREEFDSLISQTVTSKAGRGGRRTLPFVFTEHGAVMLAAVLNSPIAVEQASSWFGHSSNCDQFYHCIKTWQDEWINSQKPRFIMKMNSTLFSNFWAS